MTRIIASDDGGHGGVDGCDVDDGDDGGDIGGHDGWRLILCWWSW